ncbi:MAG: VanZ family protein [Maribacter sp.]|nr:VanZ family protein [Maribacter sp.]
MPLFTSKREKQLWLWAFVVFFGIFSTLFFGQPLAKLFSSQDVRAVIFVIVMLLVGTTILIHAIKTKPSKMELTILVGIIAVYTMFILRLGMPERSHLMEYSVLAIFIHKAILERKNQGKHISMPALIALVISFTIGVIDECIQILLPNRYFDPEDIVFNGMAAAMAIGSSVIINWVRKWKNTSKLKSKQ